MTRDSPFFAPFESRPQPGANRLLDAATGPEGDGLRALLTLTTPSDLSLDEIHAEVEGHLWMLTPEAFRYFLPAFLNAGVEHYGSLKIFVAEIVGALTEPSLDDLQQALERVAQIPAGMGLTPEALGMLRQQQLDWYNSGTPQARFSSRVDGLSAVEGAAILAFLVAIRDGHGEDFPFNEPQLAIDRHWSQYLPP